MSTIGAYIEIPPGHTEPNWFDWDNFATGRFNSKGSWGLDVEWNDPVSDNPQVYLIWEPRVVAVWNDEEEIEDGEDGEHEDDALTGLGDEEAAPESDEGSGPAGALEVGGDGGSVGGEEVE